MQATTPTLLPLLSNSIALRFHRQFANGKTSRLCYCAPLHQPQPGEVGRSMALLITRSPDEELPISSQSAEMRFIPRRKPSSVWPRVGCGTEINRRAIVKRPEIYADIRCMDCPYQVHVIRQVPTILFEDIVRRTHRAKYRSSPRTMTVTLCRHYVVAAGVS